MPYTVQVIHVQDYLKVEGISHPSLESAKGALVKIGEACRARGIDRVLFDTRNVEVPLSVPELYLLVSSLVDVDFPRSVWIAILTRPDRFDRARFAALCAGNRGWTARPVQSFEEAMTWFAATETIEGGSVGQGPALAERRTA